MMNRPPSFLHTAGVNSTAASQETTFDVIVLGSGSAGLTAGLTCAAAGLSTLILEKSASIGGTTAYSGAALWVPANHLAKAQGINDSPEQALAYLRASAPDGWAKTEAPLWESFANNAGPMLEFVEGNTPLNFQLLHAPDTFPDLDGGKQNGRMVSIGLVPLAAIGKWARKLQRSNMPQVLTIGELQENNPLAGSWKKTLVALPKIAKRLVTRRRSMGTGLVTGLLAGFLKAGGELKTDVTVSRLLKDAGGRVNGVRIEGRTGPYTLSAKRGVVIATGGFEWDDEMREHHFPGPNDYLASPPTNAGDGHKMAAAIGAQLDQMDQANLNGAIPAGKSNSLQGQGWFHHLDPDIIVVDQTGRRFGNEQDANFCGLLNQVDPNGTPAHLPSWLIGDRDFLRRQWYARWSARHNPEWLVQAQTLAELASKIGLPADVLAQTVKDFNSAAQGETPDAFGRQMDLTNSNPITRAPFVAVRFNRSFMSTKGGPRTDAHARVKHISGDVIPGLYCAGVAMANPIGTKAVSAGTTIGPNMTWGYIAARHIVGTRG